MNTKSKIFNEKLNFKEYATSKIKSLENVDYKPKSSEFQIFNDHLPWLRYNRPNLSEEIKCQIEKKDIPAQTTKPRDKLYYTESNSLNSNKVSEISPKFSRRKVNSLSETQTGVIKNSKEVTNLDIQPLNSSPSGNNAKFSRKFIVKENSKIIEKTKRYEKVDASTETEKINQVSVEIQANFSINSTENKPKKFRQAMTNSITIPEKPIKTYGDSSHYQAKELKYGKLKKKSEFHSIGKNDLITSELVDLILPSITSVTDEHSGKKYKTYSFPNTYSKILTERSTVNYLPHKLAVTHAGVDFLDKYWAAQRQMLINKENFHFRNDFSSENSVEEEDMSKFPHIYSADELQVFQEIKNNKNVSYSNQKSKINSRTSNEKLNKVTSLELEKTYV